MMEDPNSKNYNSIIVSLISELLYENNNQEINRIECYHYIVNDLKITIQQDLFIKIIERSSNFINTPNTDDVSIKLTDKKFKEINDKVLNNSIERHLSDFVEENSYPKELIPKLESLLYQAIYENINSFTIQNINSIISVDFEKKFSKRDINAFNKFLSTNSKEKNIALFNTFLKAVEFAIITSGKGVNEFTEGVFEGKEYLLDANIIFRLLGIGGEERKDSLRKLIKQCHHQGIKFYYSIESHLEFKRKVDSSIQDIKRATQNKTIEVLEEMLEEKEIDFNNGFITHYAKCKIEGRVKSPERYKTKIMADFRDLCEEYNIDAIRLKNKLKQGHIDRMQNELYEKKKEIFRYSNYTMTAAKVDAVNVLSVKSLRGNNDYNYSDIKSFYLSTDRTLNRILAEKNKEKIAETILPSQLFLLHNSLSDIEDEKDYEAFTKFLKRRTTEFKYTGKQVLSFIDEIRNYTTEPKNIKNILKAYSDEKYETSLKEIDVEPEYVSLKEFTETYMDKKLNIAQTGDGNYKKALNQAQEEFPNIMLSAKKIIRFIDLCIAILLIPITAMLIKAFTDDLFIIGIAVLIVEAIKFLLSSRLDIYSDWTKDLFLKKVKKTNFHQTYKGIDQTYLKKAKAFIPAEIKIWK